MGKAPIRAYGKSGFPDFFFFASKSGSRGARAVKNGIDRKEEDF